MKPISDFLQQLIDNANKAIGTAKDLILQVYYQAKEEGYSPKEAKKLVEEKVVTVSDRYIRELLPDESKNLNMRRLKTAEPTPQISQETETNVINIPQTQPNIRDVEPEPYKPGSAWRVKQQEERRTPEAPDHSMVQQLNHINIQLKKELEDLQELMDMRMADKDKRIRALVNDVLERDKAIELSQVINQQLKKDVEAFKDENIRLKQDIITLTNEKHELEKELGRHRRLEELRLEAQRRNIKEWRNPGDKP